MATKEVISLSEKSCEVLAQDLSLRGVKIQARSLIKKINRGSFNVAFLLQCLTALGVDQDGLLSKINNEVKSVRRTKT
jgi:hypothetical protein